MPDNDLLRRLASVYSGKNIQYPNLKSVTFAQWMIESARATSDLAALHYNFAGLKWRKEMSPFATRVKYKAHDGEDFYCKFATIESFINGYWAFLNRAPYSGWESHVSSAKDFIEFIGPIYTPPNPNYSNDILGLLPEAEKILNSVGTDTTLAATLSNTQKKDIGTIVIDPGHGGNADYPGSAANHAISVSGVKEKKLTLDFSLILRDLILKGLRQDETAKVFLTRDTDINLSGTNRAGLAFAKKAKLFLCIHFNGDKNPKTRGPETYYRAPENGNMNLAATKQFAKEIQDSFYNALKQIDPGAKNRGIKPDNAGNPTLPGFGVLNDKLLGNDKRPEQCIAAYIEAEFITNPTVEKTLISGPDAIKNRTFVMSKVADAILAHMRVN